MTNSLRFLGIDYGTKRIGLAVSDENGTLAFPKGIILNDHKTFYKIGEILKKEKIGQIIIGESVDFSGKSNALSARIEIFILELKEKFNLPIHKQKEFLTSVEARKSTNNKKSLSLSQAHSKIKQIKSGRIDASAAALILQRYLDRKNKNDLSRGEIPVGEELNKTADPIAAALKILYNIRMLRNSYNRFFPIPDFLVPPSFGLDISDESIKFAKIVATKGGIKIGQYGERKVPAGIIESGRIKKQKQLEQILLSLKKEEGIKSVRVSLPEEQVYLFRFLLEKAGLRKVREGIELALEEHVPIPAPDAIFDYELLNETEENLELQVAAIPKNVIGDYLSVFENSMIQVQSCELEAQAISRAVIKKGDLETYMIVDFGQTRTGIFIISRGVTVFTSTLDDIGGAMLIKVIQKSFNINYEEAEKMKKDYGLERNGPNKEIFSVLLNTVSVLRDEMVKHFIYWHTHKDEEGKDHPPIKKVILCGGESNLKGLAEYFSVSMKIPVELANVWTNINDTAGDIPEINFNQSLTLATAFGLALGDFDHD